MTRHAPTITPVPALLRIFREGRFLPLCDFREDTEAAPLQPHPQPFPEFREGSFLWQSIVAEDWQ